MDILVKHYDAVTCHPGPRGVPNYHFRRGRTIYRVDVEQFEIEYPLTYLNPGPVITNGNKEYCPKSITINPGTKRATVYWWGYKDPTIEPWKNLNECSVFLTALCFYEQPPRS
jgi:hypothetical protein